MLNNQQQSLGALGRVLLGSAALLSACTQSSSSQGKTQYDDAECSRLYNTLSDEHQRLIREWGAAMQAAKGTDRALEVREQGAAIEAQFLPKFEKLADCGCGEAALEVLDSFGHINPHDDRRIEYALGLLEDVAKNDLNAPWIWNLGDDDIFRYFVLSSQRGRAIELIEQIAENTADDEARCNILFKLGVELNRQIDSAKDKQAGLEILDRVVQDWPDSQEAKLAQGFLVFERTLEIGKKMPSLSGKDVDGNEISLTSFNGKVVVLDFFGFWCPPCREGLAELKTLYDLYPKDKFTIIGVNAYDDEERFRKERDAFDLSWPCIFDGEAGPIAKSLGVTSFPTVLVIDQQGMIADKNPSAHALKSSVEGLLRTK